MAKIIENFFTTIIIAVVLSIFISWYTKVETTSIKYKAGAIVSHKSLRMEKVFYSIPLMDTAANNWRHYYSNLYNKSKWKYLDGFITAESDYYYSVKNRNNENQNDDEIANEFKAIYSSFDLPYMSIITPDYKYSKLDIINKKAYYIMRNLNFSDFKMMSLQSARQFPKLYINYCDKIKNPFKYDKNGKPLNPKWDTIVEKILVQFEIAEKVLTNNGLDSHYVLIEPGFVSKKSLKKAGNLNYAVQLASQNFVGNIKKAMQLWFKSHPKSKLKLLLQNAKEYKNIPKSVGKIAKILGKDYKELLKLRKDIINVTQYGVDGIADIDKKIAISIDTSKLISVLNNPLNNIYTKKDKTKYNLMELIEIMEKDFNETVYIFAGMTKEGDTEKPTFKPSTVNSLDHIVLSYAATYAELHPVWKGLIKNRKKNSTVLSGVEKYRSKNEYLSYTKAGNKKYLLEQLELAARLVKISNIAKKGPGVINFNIPRKENFPLAHFLCRPFTEATDFKKYFIIKGDGALPDEQFTSFDWVHNYLLTRLP